MLGDEDTIRGWALALPEAWEDHPWGQNVFKVPEGKSAKVFCIMSNGEETVRASLKVDSDDLELVLQQRCCVVAPYIGRHGWVMVTVEDSEVLEMFRGLLLESYWHRAPARLRRLVEALPGWADGDG